MEFMIVFLKRIIVVSLVWKTAIQLCPQKRIREYGKSLLGIYLAFYILSMFCKLFCVDLKTKYYEETEKIENNLWECEELFTITCDVKTGFNDDENVVEKTSQMLENTEESYVEENEENSSENEKLTDNIEISTVNVESIQSINVH